MNTFCMSFSLIKFNYNMQGLPFFGNPSYLDLPSQLVNEHLSARPIQEIFPDTRYNIQTSTQAPLTRVCV